MCARGPVLSPPVAEFARDVCAAPGPASRSVTGSMRLGPRKASGRPRRGQLPATPPSVIRNPPEPRARATPPGGAGRGPFFSNSSNVKFIGRPGVEPPGWDFRPHPRCLPRPFVAPGLAGDGVEGVDLWGRGGRASSESSILAVHSRCERSLGRGGR